MPVRDIFLFVLIFGSLPFVFKRPWLGILVCAWLGYMNPHRFSWGPAYSFPFVALVAAVTILAFFFSSETKKLPNNVVIFILLALLAWVSLTTLTALNPHGAVYEWKRFFKIQILNFLAIYLFQSRERINCLIAVIAGSIGFFAFKGGIFTILTGGIYSVTGPADSFITGNTEIGFASTVILPLMFYFWTIAPSKWQKNLLIAAMIFSSLGIIGTHSRGAFLAFGVLCIYFWWVSRHKVFVLILLVCLIPVLFSVMPDKYFDRMDTIQTYEEDASAMGRINAWWFAFNLANDRPLVGGGANTFTPELFYRYAPQPENYHDVHSIYFEMLGEQGYPGLLIFIAMLFFSYRNCVWVSKKSIDRIELKWAFDLARMLQASFVAYAVGGAFLGLAYFDLLYHLVALTVLLRVVVENEMKNLGARGQLSFTN
ncbi:putative O-glycosylation ligase, exosortase A system-associated [Deltaproteobacteria bacterium]|nr:putative O-glycosylation ligase, exosortase A system-associated [Deltaproteobacteria bacterium]